eukprot:TRINITY_DN4272_c0_g1_i1.p1 TRINITY_DN4272_c0_g1~~TRINITY_DN4272_c0_g1_i1.p1  ORF type:complete len:114 (+),score=18.35 TRINITY_DN4272_c0_g1_i1:95-436(+)
MDLLDTLLPALETLASSPNSSDTTVHETCLNMAHSLVDGSLATQDVITLCQSDELSPHIDLFTTILADAFWTLGTSHYLPLFPPSPLISPSSLSLSLPSSLSYPNRYFYLLRR